MHKTYKSFILNIYFQQRRWKIGLFIVAILIVSISLWYTNDLVKHFANNERININVWANAIQRKANLVNYANRFFEQIQKEEQKRAELLAETYKRIATENNSKDITFYLNIIKNNTTIPVILTNEDGTIISFVNIDNDVDSLKKFMSSDLKKQFNVFNPIPIYYSTNDKNILYYKESNIYTELRQVINDLIQSFFSEIVENSISTPVIVTDSLHQTIYAFGNIDSLKIKDTVFVKKTIDEMKNENEPIEIHLPNSGKTFIYYHNSFLLNQIKYYPYIQFLIIGLFFIIVYLVFNTFRKSEQNQVWVGMSKETAHQLGTPLSSIIAWVEILKMKKPDRDVLSEMEKDLERLKNITDRFSKIGSQAKLENQNIITLIYDSLNYIKNRTSKKVNYHINYPENSEVFVPVNKHLFEWVIENLCKNAIDAMNGIGTLTIKISDMNKHVIIDFIDTGKGISKSNFKTVFNPGFTTKSRGWGLGLTLSERIMKNYHRGKIFVKSSSIDQGTTFRILLKKELLK